MPAQIEIDDSDNEEPSDEFTDVDPYTTTPDVVIMSNRNESKVAGELKIPWVEEHMIKEVYRMKRSSGSRWPSQSNTCRI